MTSSSPSSTKKNSSLLDLFSSAIPRNVSNTNTIASTGNSLLDAVSAPQQRQQQQPQQLQQQQQPSTPPAPIKSPRPISPSASSSSISGKVSPSSSTSSIKSASLTKGLFKSLLSSASSSTSKAASIDGKKILKAKKNHQTPQKQQPISIATRPKETITQELRKNVAISFNSQEISQIKVSSSLSPEDPGCLNGSLLVETSNCIAYAMSSGKIRLISNETGATGVISQHSPSSLENPIIDLAWSLQTCPPSSSGAPFSHVPSQQILASLTAHGDLCVGSVMAESPTTLRYDSIITTKLPRIQESYRRAAGLSWNGSVDRPILAIWSKSLSDDDDDDEDDADDVNQVEKEEEIFLIDFSSQEEPETTAITVKLSSNDGIQSLKFDSNFLYVADKKQVVVLDIGAGLEEGMMNARTVELPKGVERIWVLPNPSGTWAMALVEEKLQIISLKTAAPTTTMTSSSRTVVLDVALPGFEDLRLNDAADARRASLGLWCCFDAGEGVIVVGSRLANHSKILCIRLYDGGNVIMTVGRLPINFEGGLLSVFAAPQKHDNDGNIYTSPNSTLSLYLYPISGALYLTSVMIDWSSTTTLSEESSSSSITSILGKDKSALQKTKKKKPTSPKEAAFETLFSVQPSVPQKEQGLLNQLSLDGFGSLIKEEIRACIPCTDKLAQPIANQLSPLLAPTLVGAIENSLEGRVLPGLVAVIKDSMEMISKSLHESMMNAWKELFMANLAAQQEYIDSSIAKLDKDLKDYFADEVKRLYNDHQDYRSKSEKSFIELSKTIKMQVDRTNSSFVKEFGKLKSSFNEFSIKNNNNLAKIASGIPSPSDLADSLSSLIFKDGDGGVIGGVGSDNEEDLSDDEEEEEIEDSDDSFADATTPSDDNGFNVNSLITVLNNADPKDLTAFLKRSEVCSAEALATFDSEVLLAFLQQLGNILSSPDIEEDDYSIVIAWLDAILLGNPSPLNDFAAFSNKLALESEDLDSEEGIRETVTAIFEQLFSNLRIFSTRLTRLSPHYSTLKKIMNHVNNLFI